MAKTTISAADTAKLREVANKMLNIGFRMRKDLEEVQNELMPQLAAILGVKEVPPSPNDVEAQVEEILDPQALLDQAKGQDIESLSRAELITLLHGLGLQESDTKGKSVKELRSMVAAQQEANPPPAPEPKKLVKFIPKSPQKQLTLPVTNGISSHAKLPLFKPRKLA